MAEGIENLVWNHRGDYVINLNVGGMKYTSTSATLCNYPDAPLTKMVNEHRVALQNGKTLLLDRDGKMFRHVLNFLRTGSLQLPDNFAEFKLLRTEMKHYGLLELADMSSTVESGAGEGGGIKKRVDDAISVGVLQTGIEHGVSKPEHPSSTDQHVTKLANGGPAISGLPTFKVVEHPLAKAVLESQKDLVKDICERAGCPGLVKVLALGKPLDYVPPGKGAAIHVAVMKNDARAVKLLLSNGADPKVFDAHKETCLSLALKKKASSIVDILCEHYGVEKIGSQIQPLDSIGTTKIHELAQKGDLKLLRMLREHGVDLLGERNTFQATAIVYAIEGEQLETAKFLLEDDKFDPALKYREGNLLHVAVRNGMSELLEPLLEKGVDISHTNSEGLTPMGLAKKLEDLECQAILKPKIDELVKSG